MHQIKNSLALFTLLALFSCIKPYTPKIDASAEKKYVVSGRVTDKEGWQEVEVSLSSPIESPGYIPVSGCQVMILDDKGNIFSLEEYNPGLYHVWMGQEHLTTGTSYRVRVSTPDGAQLVSGFDKMPAGPKLDTVYYAIKYVPTADPQIFDTVMQFYVDLNAQGSYSQYYKWEIDETWEYQSAHRIEYYYDGTIHHVSPPDYSKMTCWITSSVKNVFTLSTKSLSQNTYNAFPLHGINGHTPRLGILYSILVSQLALTEGAYNYWEQLRINSNEQGGLYEKQPLAIKGNLVDESNPTKDVLGYFYAATESSSRYFYHDIAGITLKFGYDCYPEELGVGGWHNILPWWYPVYFYYYKAKIYTFNIECVDCRARGGTIVKPDFWPK
jgi:hypothetical protein